MNAAKLAHPALDQLTAFAQGRLGEAELSEIHAHLSDCAECRNKVEASGDDTLVSLLRAADTNTNTQEKKNLAEPVTVAVGAQAPATPDLPAELAQHGRYRVQELLGVGGMGAVYKAEHLLMERPVALKLISHSLTSNPAMIERFRREVKTAGQLRHPNIVMAYDAEQAGESHFLVMEYVEGKSLARVVADQGPLPVREACDYVRQAAVGLQYAHERGMVHRDIKPQNLMLTPEGQVKIVDFGLARFAMEAAPAGSLLAGPQAAEAPASASLTQVGIVMGTPDYIAPEQARDAHTADIRADIYSLGCTLYDLLAGRAPFAEGTVMSKVMAHVERMPQPLGEIRKDVPPELARVIERMMAKDPAKRYQTPAEAATALARFAAPGTQSRGRRTAFLAAAAVALIGVLGITGYYYGATIYRIVTNEGELIVQVDDPEIEIVLKQKGVLVEDRATKQSYQVNIGPNDLKAGNYELKVTNPAGLEVFTRQFTITRNGKTPVKVTWDTRQAKGKSEHDILQGTWLAESVDGDGLSVKGEQLTKHLFVTLTVDAGKAHLRYRMGGDNGPLTREVAEGTLELDPAKDPERIVIAPSLANKNRLVGIYRRDAETLRLCYRLNPPANDYPTEFAAKPAGTTYMVLKLLKGSLPAGPAETGAKTQERLINTFGPGFQPITRDGVTADQGAWRIDTTSDRVVRFYEAQPPLEDCLVTYRARIKSLDLKGKAYLEMYCRFSWGGEYFSRGLMNAISGSKDWVTVEIPFFLQKEERPDLLKLNLHVEGAGTVWIKDIELWQAPLPPELRRPSNMKPAAGFTPGVVKIFSQTDKPISDRVQPDQKGWRITGKGGTIRLFEVKDFKDDACMATYRAQLKSSALKGQAYLEMLVHLPGDPDDAESFSRGLAMPLTGTSDWASYETPFRLEKGQRPDRIRLNLVIQGEGTVWIKDVELLRGPLGK